VRLLDEEDPPLDELFEVLRFDVPDELLLEPELLFERLDELLLEPELLFERLEEPDELFLEPELLLLDFALDSAT
jgi:hypothetical protein